MRIAAIIGTVLVAAVFAGCGGSDESSEPATPLREGVYEYELSEQYLLDNEISTQQAAMESGRHEVALEGGDFVDRWRTTEGTTGACRGTYEADGNRFTFRWTEGCFGDWAMSYAVEGDQVVWSDHEALEPYDSDEDQNVTEVFNGVPWKWLRTASADDV
jgi:hypothetical protein